VFPWRSSVYLRGRETHWSTIADPERTTYRESEFEGGYVELVRDDFEHWLDAQAKLERGRKRGDAGQPGAPPTYDYDVVKGEAFRLFKKKRGLPERTGEDGWRTRADLERALAEFSLRIYEKEPAKRTLQDFAQRAIDEWTAQKAAKGY
jgi:hypothetical protein